MAKPEHSFPVRESSVYDEQAAKAVFGQRLQIDVPLARYTAARVGGAAEGLIQAKSAEDLAEITGHLWEMEVPFVVFGGGSNILVSDRGLSGVAVLNKARRVRFDLEKEPPQVWAESGANLGSISRQAATRGLAGLEWAAGIPGTLGGAIVGNAGAHGGDTAGNLLLADILHREDPERPRANGDKPIPEFVRDKWMADRFQFAYRSSVIKGTSHKPTQPGRGGAPTVFSPSPRTVVLSAWLGLELSNREAVNARMEENLNYRRTTQPPGASMGSMFKNPPGDFAGRLIEAAGLKGTRVGKAQISPLHGNFFINHGGASAGDIWQLIQLARDQVIKKFGVELELEIEFVGDWTIEARQ